MINTHRDIMLETLELFCKRGTFVDIKIGYASYLLPKVHFTAQLVLALKQASCFEDHNNVLGDL